MRRIIDVLVAVMVCTLVMGVIWLNKSDRQATSLREQVREEVRQFQQVIDIRTALEEGDRNHRGHPVTVDPAWFKGEPPRNPLLPPTHPWVEIAVEGQHDLEHPPDRIAAGTGTARFWYNPWRGVVRARVPHGASDGDALELYNHVNASNVSLLFDPPDRTAAEPSAGRP